MSKLHRTNSSLNTRAMLDANYVSNHQAHESVSIDKYMNLAKEIFYNSASLYNKHDYKRAYTTCKEFQALANQTIPSFGNPHVVLSPATCNWLSEARTAAKDMLDEIIAQLDVEEDIRQKPHMKASILAQNAHIDILIPEWVDPSSHASTPARQISTSVTPAKLSLEHSHNPSKDSHSHSSPRSTPTPLMHSHSTPHSQVHSANHSHAPSPIPLAHPHHPLAHPPVHTPSPHKPDEEHQILTYLQQFAEFPIPPPSVTECFVQVGPGCEYFFEQHDFHLSYTPYLKNLPPHLLLSRAGVEVNRCFFVHLGIACQIHPFVLQTYFRTVLRLENKQEADWEKELAKTVQQYSGCVDANVLQYTWPENMNKYRLLIISGPVENPLLTCFEPVFRPTHKPNVSDLYEIILRNDRDHYTLLRPLGGGHHDRIQIIDQIMHDAHRNHKVAQLCPVKSVPGRSVEYVMKMKMGEIGSGATILGTSTH